MAKETGQDFSNVTKDLLQEADPLRVESEPSAADRGIQRQAILTSAADMPQSTTKSRSRFPVYLGIMLIAIAAFAAGSRLWPPFISDVQAAVRFEVRLVEPAPAPGLTQARVAGGGTVYVHNEVIVTNSDIAQAKVIPQPDGSQFWVGVTFTADGARKIHEATANNIGKRMAILIDGEVVTAPVVREALNESAVVNGYISREEAERIVAGIMIR